MEKLIELLNEYEKRERGISNARTTNFAFLYYLNNPAPISELNLISKKYWFIQWLVENEKIEEWNFFYNTWDLPDDDVSKLLMLLAIKDEPIEFLVSILK